MITKEEWEKKLKDVKIRKEDMNKLVMNFLVTEGYVDAAEKFRLESGTERILSLFLILLVFIVDDFLFSFFLFYFYLFIYFFILFLLMFT